MLENFWLGFEKRAMSIKTVAKAAKSAVTGGKSVLQKAVTTAEHGAGTAVGHAVPAVGQVAKVPQKFTPAQLQAAPHYSDHHELRAARQQHLATQDATANRFQKGVGLVDHSGAPLPVKAKVQPNLANPHVPGSDLWHKHKATADTATLKARADSSLQGSAWRNSAPQQVKTSGLMSLLNF